MSLATRSPVQMGLFESSDQLIETPGYYSEQIITYIGNKRSLLGPISEATTYVASQLGKEKLRIFDGFSGSGVVSRLFKSVASELVVNDLESYSRVINECFLTNWSSVNFTDIQFVVDKINQYVDHNTNRKTPGFIELLYAPQDDNNIKVGERVFYTRSNARRLDQFRNLIEAESSDFFNLLMGPLLASASVHANTAGVFKGFYKERSTRIGKFGGTGADALKRITGQIRLRVPILSRHEADVTVYQTDTNDLVSKVGNFDLAYFDPPYNQHPYGSNYFMLNLLVDYKKPQEISKISGIPKDWNRSLYNKKKRAWVALTDLISRVDSRYVLLSFNNEGFVSPAQLRKMLNGLGTVQEIKIRYNTYRGSRNLYARNTHVTEHLYLLEKKAR